MRKLLVGTALAVALVAPAKAQQWSPQNFATVMAVMGGYEVKCGGLPPKSKMAYVQMVELMDPKELAPAALNVMAEMSRRGLTTWCSDIRSVLVEMEASIR